MTDFLLGVETGTTHIWAGRFSVHLEPGVWTAISLNVPDDVDPEDDPRNTFGVPAPWRSTEGFKAVVDDWNGAIYASGRGTNGSYLIHGGGHGAYYGNEVLEFSFDSFQWSLLTFPTYPWVLDYTNGELASGEPMSNHNYDGMQYDVIRNELLLPAVSSPHDLGGNMVQLAHVLDLDTATWRRGGSFSTSGSAVTPMGSYDITRELHWIGFSGLAAFLSYDAATDTYTQYSTNNCGVDVIGEIDPDHDIFVFGSSVALQARDLANPNNAPVTLTTTGTAPANNGARYGWVWVPTQMKFYLWDGGTGFITLTPPADGIWATSTWTWGTVAAVSGSPDAVNVNSTYSRLQWVDSLECLVVINRTSGAVYAFKPVI